MLFKNKKCCTPEYCRKGTKMKLNKTQSYAIQYLLTQNKNAMEIATELKLPVDSVQKYIEKHQIASKDNNIPATTSKVTASDLMIRHTRDKKTNSVAIMTKEASELADASKQKNTPKPSSDHIYRPR